MTNDRNLRMRHALEQRMKNHAKKQAEQKSAKQKNLGNSPMGLERRLQNSGLGNMMPGNVGDINKVVWPFFFTMNAPILSPATTSQASFTVSQEAAFIWMSFSKVVFLRTGAGPNYDYTAIDPNDESANGDANGLKVQFRDSQSSRVFQKNPMPLDAYGSPDFPTVLPTPMMFLPNSTIECLYSNTDAANVYVPWITFFGYRVRIEDAQNILSLVTG